MDKCRHSWVYIGSKRQQIWRCAHCDEYRLDDPSQKREWQGLTDEEVEATASLGVYKKPLIEFARAIEAKLKEKNND